MSVECYYSNCKHHEINHGGDEPLCNESSCLVTSESGMIYVLRDARINAEHMPTESALGNLVAFLAFEREETHPSYFHDYDFIIDNLAEGQFRDGFISEVDELSNK